jgi:hypothetical protein
MLASLLIRSAGITLVLGLAAWLAVTCWRDPAKAMRRCKTFVPLLLAGLIVQAGWMAWIKKAEAPAEWPVDGYLQSYTSQLRIKNGNEPELGAASAADLPMRVAQNLAAHAIGFIEAVTGKGGRLPHAWYAPWVIGPVFLIVLGLYASVWPTGGQPQDWYFVAHESMYLLWPWDLEMRFILPIVPLACLYLWRGIRMVVGGEDVTTSYRPAAAALCMVVFFLNAGTLTRIARENLAFDVTHERTSAPMLAGKWIRSHTPLNTVVMARQMDVVYHYADRRVVWFPPISDPAVLYAGIQRHHVSLIVVEADRGVETYWRPGETDCFERLLKAYPGTFTLIQRGRYEHIYAVVPEEADDQEPRESTPEDASAQAHSCTTTFCRGSTKRSARSSADL